MKVYFISTMIVTLTICNVSTYASVLSSNTLKGRVSLVTGGSRGIGAGIAKSLAEAGSKVYVTARSTITATETVLGGTLSELENGNYNEGKIIGCYCDHNNDDDVKKVIERISTEEGRLDILVNNAFQVPDNSKDPDLLFRNFWEQPGEFWDKVIDVGLRSHYITSCYAFPLLNKTAQIESSQPISLERNPLIVHVSSFGGVSYSFNVAYGVGKAGVDRMARDMSKELKPYDISCISVYPGVVRTERMRTILDGGEWKKRTGLATPSEYIESPLLTGRVIAALYNEREKNIITRKNGETLVIAEVAKQLNITDINGNIPPSIRSLKFLVPSVMLGKYPDLPDNIKKFILNDIPDILLPMSFMRDGAPDQ